MQLISNNCSKCGTFYPDRYIIQYYTTISEITKNLLHIDPLNIIIKYLFNEYKTCHFCYIKNSLSKLIPICNENHIDIKSDSHYWKKNHTKLFRNIRDITETMIYYKNGKKYIVYQHFRNDFNRAVKIKTYLSDIDILKILQELSIIKQNY